MKKIDLIRLLQSSKFNDFEFFVQVGFNRFPVTRLDISPDGSAGGVAVFSIAEDADNPPVEMPSYIPPANDIA